MARVSVTELARAIAVKHGLKMRQAEAFVNALIDVVNEGLRHDKLVKVKGLGTFKVIDIKNRESVDVNTGERIVIEGRGKITFTPDTVMRDLVNKPFAQFETVVVNEGVDFSEIDARSMETEQLEQENDDDADEQVQAPAAQIKPDAPEVEWEKAPIEETIDALLDIPQERQSVESEPSEENPAVEPVADRANDAVSPETVSEKSESVEAQAEKSVAVPVAPVVVLETPTSGDEASEPAYEEEDDAPSRWRTWLSVAALALLCACAGAYGGYMYGKHEAASDYAAKERERIALMDSIARMDAAAKARVQAAENSLADSMAALRERAKADSAARAEQMAQASEAAESTLPVADQPEPKANETTGQGVPESINTQVRLGAYRIVGLDQTVTVRKGQTLKSISKAFFGPDMECYVAYYNGTTEVVEGQKLKIPKLQIKKKSK